MTDRLALRSTRRARSLEVALAGELDMATGFRAESELERLLTTPDIDGVVLDLEEVSFVDSAGLGVLLSVREQATRLGRDMRVDGMSEPVRRILEATATGSILGAPDETS